MAGKRFNPDSNSANVWIISCCALLISIGINFTRVPIIYAFHTMTCEEFYRHNPPYTGNGDACSIPQIEASSAQQISILGTTITINGIFNLVITNWSMKTFGLKTVLIQQLVGPTIRLGFQLFGGKSITLIHVGGSRGITLVQLSQLLGVVGGSTGYVIVLTTFVSRMVEPARQTSAFGQMHGGIMLGTAIAYIVGGVVNDAYGITVAFEAACGFMVLAILFSLILMPSLPSEKVPSQEDSPSVYTKIAKPFQILLPNIIPGSSPPRRTYQRTFLAIGVLCGVLATGFIPILLQMYSTNRFGFDSRENGYLMGLTFGFRSLFLTGCFPFVITVGRKWFSPNAPDVISHSTTTAAAKTIVLPASEADSEATPLLTQSKKTEKHVDTRFDLWFLTASFFADAILTAGTAYCQEGWQLYLGKSAAVLPLASGSAPAAKGVVVSLCEPSERADALAGIAMVEMLATVMTMTLFGGIFSALANIGRSNLVFFVNGALALLAAIITLFVRVGPTFQPTEVFAESSQDGET